MSLPENFCIAPFLQLQISKNGDSGPCPYVANIWQLGNLKTIEEKWNSDQINEFRQSFLDNKKHTSCSRCWRDEKAGKYSLRQRLNNFKNNGSQQPDRSENISIKIFEKYINNKDYKKYPKILTLIPGNECNLACATCGPTLSSKWNSVVKKYKDNDMIKNTNNFNLTVDEYKDIVDNSEYLQKIELFGGEPFYNKKNRELLIDSLISKGTSKNITLYFNTNGTIYDEKFIEKITKYFKKIEIRLSMDGVFQHFEYLRYGAKFDDVVKNAEKFKKSINTDFEIICTISPYNFFYVEKYDKFFKSMNWSVFYNLTSYPSHLLCFNIPESVKKNIHLHGQFEDIESYIKNNKCDNKQWLKFVKYTQILDKNRHLTFKNTFPEFYELVKFEGFELANKAK